MPKKWTRHQREFQEWLALPKYDRLPPNQQLFAATMGMDNGTLSRWKKLDGWQEAVNEIAQSHLRVAVPEVMGALRREAEKGSFQHIKLFLEMMGMHVDKQESSGDLRIRIERDTDDYDTFAYIAHRTSRSDNDGETI